MLGALHVVGVDVDGDALRVAQQNAEEYEEPLPVGWQALLVCGRACACVCVCVCVCVGVAHRQTTSQFPS